MAIVGPSGAGKTTLLRLIAGLEHPTTGRLLLDGDECDELPPSHRDVAMMFEEPALVPGRSVRHHLGIGARLHLGIGPMSLLWERLRGKHRRLATRNGEIDRSVEEIATTLGLKGLLDARVEETSSGERQRTALGRALVRGAGILLLDEPTGRLDAPRRTELRGYLRRIHESFGLTMIHVTHDQTEAMALGTRMGVLCDGRLVQLGRPEDVRDEPTTRFVGSFVGDPPMSFVPGHLVAEERGKRFLAEGNALSVDLSECEQSGQLASTRVILGVRPEHVRLREKEGNCQGTVTATELRGAFTTVDIAVGGVRLSALASTREVPRRGTTIGLELAGWSLFDADTDRALIHHRGKADSP